jgi:uncharacterized protein YciI
MLYVIFCTDKADHAHVRAATRPDHLDYVGGFKEHLVTVGPTLSDDGEGMNGSLLVVDFPDREAVDDFAQGDPYAKAGLFESVIIRPWKQVIPKG